MRILFVVVTLALTACAGGPETPAPEGEPSTEPAMEPAAPPPMPGDVHLASCEHGLECGGEYYDTAEECAQAGRNYWGECEAMLNALDAFGACILNVPCGEYNPDAYIPADIGCGAEYAGLGDVVCE